MRSKKTDEEWRAVIRCGMPATILEMQVFCPHSSPDFIHFSCCGARYLPWPQKAIVSYRPRPLAQVALSAPGSAPIAPPPGGGQIGLVTKFYRSSTKYGVDIITFYGFSTVLCNPEFSPFSTELPTGRPVKYPRELEIHRGLVEIRVFLGKVTKITGG